MEDEAQQHRDVPFVVELTAELGLVVPVGPEDEIGREAFDREPAQIDARIEQPDNRPPVRSGAPDADRPFLRPPRQRAEVVFESSEYTPTSQSHPGIGSFSSGGGVCTT